MPGRPRYDHPTVFNFLHDYGADLEARRVYLHAPIHPIEDWTIEQGVAHTIKNLMFLDKWKQSEPIELYLNTPGGDLSEMWALIDTIRQMQTQVSTIAQGNVSSAGCLILVAGTGTRYATEYSSFMWHAGTTDITPDMHWPDARDRMAWETREKNRWIALMADLTTPRDEKGRLIKTKGGRVSHWAKWVDEGGESWLTAEEMIAHGVVDEIWSRD